MNRYLVLIVLLVFTIISALVLAWLNLLNPPTTIKTLGLTYIENTYFGPYSSMSPEAVTAIVWDYRGLDTVYETAVFFLAIVGGLSVFRGVKTRASTMKGIGLTGIAKTSTKIIAVMIVGASASIALHGHLTPGGGFQGGSTLAVAFLLIIPVFSVYSLLNMNITSEKLIATRGIALTAIGIVALLPVLKNLPLVSNISFYPSHIAGMLTSGSLFFYNLFEYIAVASGFTAVFIYLSLAGVESEEK
ncbi:Na(+)/H(+) antiporter subunit B [Desulfurococcus amylolyticus]|uniref:Na+/H+ antiporter MnhB subunit-related protein n=1 Tax=Desulfurococcus amylolyticus DSM 16532 TaxID=768672 RepID=I3XSN6_DESAM|nr:Na(+)/H(+) antiporter subunit B [Desulfurococcus amylolyticus]AFL66960.1 Na+/H+ antiporter MnhB subunit-related protein [Desulfurococcus amylolyticus DSM 16532]